MSFNKKNYQIIKNIINKELTDFLHNYILIKRSVFLHLIETRYISEFNQDWGVWNDKQVSDCFSHYGDIAMETLLQTIKPIIEKETNLKLIETYAFGRVYDTGKELKRHKDRMSCEISGTLNLGGDMWPIYVEPNSKLGYYDDKGFYYTEGTEGTEILLNPGDLLIYKGCELEHWRKPFKGKICNQVFLHYNKISYDKKLNNKFDGRPMLGLPSYFKNYDNK